MIQTKTTAPWPHHAVIYQLYIRSFFDSDGDGIGDLRGIINKLDYLRGGQHSLNVDAVWITPFYPSPMKDFGYDITDHRNIDPLFGHLDDFVELLAQAHQRGLKILIDLVPNHTSDQHEWFRAASSSRDNPKRDWYVWHDGRGPVDQPPNNWESVFGGSSWTWHEPTKQYYLHSFLQEQPDLNWDNPEVRAEMQAQMKFWCDLGVDGFRVDAVSWLSKDPFFRDEPIIDASRPGHEKFAGKYDQKGPQLYKYLQCMANVLEQYDDRFMLTEAYPGDWSQAREREYVEFYRGVNPRVSAPINFEPLMNVWDPQKFKHTIDTFQSLIEPTDVPVYCLGNHDKSRVASRMGAENIRTAALLLLSLPGMPIIYYGEELGLSDGDLRPEHIQDPYEKRVPGHGFGRDPARLPLPWTTGAQAGFSKVTPWLPAYDGAVWSVETQLADSGSTLNFYRLFLEFRQQHPALLHGDYQPLDTPPGTYGFIRQHDTQKLAVVINFTGQEIENSIGGETRFSTHGPTATSGKLWPHEGQVVELTS